MRIGLLIKDHEYRAALTRCISEYDSDILLDVIGVNDAVEPDALIITDAKPADLDKELLNKIADRTVFLDSLVTDVTNDSFHVVFKYSSVSMLLAEISDIYCNWRGLEKHGEITSKIIACCFDSDAFSLSRCSKFARQIIYRQGGSVLIIPLGYINESNKDYGKELNRFARMMYRVRTGKELRKESISYNDSYGISRLMLPPGRNPVAYLAGDDLHSLISAMSSIYDTVILDVATCYRPENMEAVQNASHVVCFETGRRRINFPEITGGAACRIIKADEDGEDDFAMDEYIREIYGLQDVN